MSKFSCLASALFLFLLFIEHVFAIGHKVRRDNWRRDQFQKRHKPLLELEHESALDAPPTNPTVPNKEDHPDNTNVFAEDVRIYGDPEKQLNRNLSEWNFSKPPWPTTEAMEKKLNSSDKQWDIEHGDTIHPLAFSRARLSQKIPTEKDRKWIDGKNLSVGSTDISLTVASDEVPRALLLRCWERAVHAASCTAYAPVETTMDSNGIGNFGFDSAGQTSNTSLLNAAASVPTYKSDHDAASKSLSATKAKCNLLGVTKLKSRSLSCPKCTRAFGKVEALKQHYYGGDSGKGCCWWEIVEKQKLVIEKVLEKHVKTQTDLLMGAIMNSAKSKIPDEPSAKRRRLLNWHDILKFMESMVESSNPVPNNNSETFLRKPGAHPALETLQIKENASPLVLNPSILEAARRRLLDRYADVPR